MTVEQKRTFCRVCEPACGLVATVDGGRLLALAADSDHPVSRGFVCNKGLYGADLHNDPDRLNVPLKRAAPGRFEPVGWEEALADIAQRLRATIDRHGAGAVAACTGNPAAFNSLFGPAFGGLLAQLGVRTTFSSGTQDCSNKFAGSEAVFGTRTLHPVPDIDRAGLIVLFGENPAVSHMSFVSMPHPMRRLREAQARGARIVHVNPRRTESAAMAGEHLPILPATGAYEREDINITGLGMQDQPSVQFTEAVVPPAFERKPEWWIYGRLAQRMGLRSPLDEPEGPDLWARTDAMLRSRGQSMSALREAGVLVFERSRPESLFDAHLQTDDHRVDCCPPSFAEAIARMHTLFAEQAAEPPGQLRLIGKRDPYMLNSWYGNLPKLKAQGRDHNPLFMHPDDARARRIADGDPVRVANRFGAVETRVRFSDQLMPGVVAMTHGWGQAASPGLSVAQRTAGVNCNVLLPSGPGAFEPISNQSHMTGIAVEVAPAPSSAAAAR